MKHLTGLNGVRALSVLAVVWHHSRPAAADWPASGSGFLGVDVFFVLSGFLITALLIEERQKRGEVSLGGFYWRRFLRIFPLYFAILGLLTVYYLFARGAHHRDAWLEELPTHLLFLSNWYPSSTLMGVGWSLSTEEQFYLVWPPLFVLLGRRAVWLLGGFLVANQAVNFGLIRIEPSRNISQVTYAPIVLGSLLAFGLASAAGRRWLGQSTAGWRLYLPIVGMLLLAGLATDMQGLPRLSFHLCTAWALAGIVTQPNARPVRCLEWRPLAYIGTVSYGVYLLHEILLDRVGHVLTALHLGDSWQFPACAVATIGVAHLSYQFFERPMLRLKTGQLLPAKAVPWLETR